MASQESRTGGSQQLANVDVCGFMRQEAPTLCLQSQTLTDTKKPSESAYTPPVCVKNFKLLL